jgi:hypothetical protein
MSIEDAKRAVAAVAGDSHALDKALDELVRVTKEQTRAIARFDHHELLSVWAADFPSTPTGNSVRAIVEEGAQMILEERP